MENIKLRVGQVIREARNRREITQKELADKVGILESTMSKYENGKINPSLEMLDRIAKELGLSLEVKFK